MELTIDQLTAEQLKQYNPVLFETIQKSVDPNEEMQALKNKLEAGTTTNTELTDKNTSLTTEVEDLKKENTTLKDENDKFKAEKALAEKKEAVNALLKEADLPKEIVTDHFRESLLKLDEEGIKAAIEDRKTIAEANKGNVTESGDEFDSGTKETKETKETKKATEADKDEVLDAVRG